MHISRLMPCFCLVTLLAIAGPLPSGAEVFGEAVPAEATASIAEIVAAPMDWDGREVVVEGRVVGRCEMKGCWIDLMDEDSRLRIKVEDDVIVFPFGVEDHLARAVGVVEVRDMDKESWERWQEHMAEEEGREFDPSSIGEPPYRWVQIKASGAEVEG